MDVRLVSVYRGTIWHVVAFEVDDECPTYDYLDHAESKNRKDRDRLMDRIKMVADSSYFRNHEIFNHEGDGIFVFKTHAGLRLYCFQDEGRLIVMVSGADKPKKKQQQKDIAMARKWRDRYLDAKKAAVAKIEITYEEA